jgi:hypothetical protein
LRGSQCIFHHSPLLIGLRTPFVFFAGDLAAHVRNPRPVWSIRPFFAVLGDSNCNFKEPRLWSRALLADDWIVSILYAGSTQSALRPSYSLPKHTQTTWDVVAFFMIC